METINKNNINDFINYYHNFHNCNILDIKYDIEKSIVELVVDVWEQEKSILKKDNIYETKKTKLRMVFNDIKDFSENNPYCSNYIDSTLLKYFKMHGDDLIVFSLYSEDPDEDPILYIVAKNIKYEEID